jgi:uncharacterized protein YjlB
MAILEEAKRLLEKLTGHARPAGRDLAGLVRRRTPQPFRFTGDGAGTPNNPRLALVLYRSAVKGDERYHPATVFEELFRRHGWRKSWRNGIYPFRHFPTTTHEVLGIARGHAVVEFGGAGGRRLAVKMGDVVVLPAGTGHRRLGGSHDLVVVGAYPAGGTYDEPRPGEIDREKAEVSIRRVKLPKQDPVYGGDGPLLELWNGRTPKPRRAARRRR